MRMQDTAAAQWIQQRVSGVRTNICRCKKQAVYSGTERAKNSPAHEGEMITSAGFSSWDEPRAAAGFYWIRENLLGFRGKRVFSFGEWEHAYILGLTLHEV